MLKEVIPNNLFDFYFDDGENERIFNRISDKCYIPANRIILENIRKYEEEDRPFKVAYSFSGIFLEQCQKYRSDVLDSFVSLVETDKVEVMSQTYYHSLVSLYEEKDEFHEQVKMHKELIWDIFSVKPKTFENTELIYNDRIAMLAESMGFKIIFSEGVVANPNYVYRPQGTEIALLLRNYQLTDDIGFRFSSKWWEEYPLTADKYASWLAATPGECVNIFCDYETFGEHQWKDTGIFEFLKYLPEEVLRWNDLRFATPDEIADNNPHREELSVERTISWADLERDVSCWLGNALQQACFIYQKKLEAPIKESRDLELIEIWRVLGLSDHLYYIFTHGGGPGEVHSYFSPYGTPYDAAVTYFSILSDLHFRLKKKIKLADDQFRFATLEGEFFGEAVWSLVGLEDALDAIDINSLEYHNNRNDFAMWARSSLGNEILARKLDSLKDLKGEELRKSLLQIIRAKLEAGN